MKKIYSIIVLLVMTLIAGTSLNSCDDNLPATNDDQTCDLSVNTDTIPKKAAKKETTDSILSKFDAKICTIEKRLDEMEENVDINANRASELQKGEKWIWTSIGLGAIALILCLICCKMYLKLKDMADQQYEDISKLKDDIQGVFFPQKTAEKHPSLLELDSLKSRVSELEAKMRQTTPKQHIMPGGATMPYTPTTCSNHGYFGNPINGSEPYFKKVLPTLDAEARFEVDINGNKGVFRPLVSTKYLGSVVSMDAMRVAIELKGRDPKNSTSMRVVSPGKVERCNYRWRIIEKAIVELS